MTIASSTPELAGWTRVVDEYPHDKAEIEVLHFGGSEDALMQNAIVDHWGVCPDGGSGHGKRSTVTHWRLRKENQ